MDESILKSLHLHLPEFSIPSPANSLTLLLQPKSPPSLPYSLHLRYTSTSLHLILIPSNFPIPPSLQDVFFLHCMHFNSLSQAVYLAVKRGTVEVHADTVVKTGSCVGVLVKRMMQWILGVKLALGTGEMGKITGKINVVSDEIRETVRNTLHFLHLQHYFYRQTDSQVKLRGRIDFHRLNSLYFSLTLTISSSLNTDFILIKVQSVSLIPANPSHIPSIYVDRSDGKWGISVLLALREAGKLREYTLTAMLRLYLVCAEATNCFNGKGSVAWIDQLPDLGTEIAPISISMSLLSTLGLDLPPSAQSSTPHPSFSYSETRFSSALQYSQTLDLFTSAAHSFPSSVSTVLFPAVRFDLLSQNILTIENDLISVCKSMNFTGKKMKNAILQLIEVINSCNKANLRVNFLSSAWFLHKNSGNSVILPIFKHGKFGLERGKMGNSAIFTFAALRKIAKISKLDIKYRDFVEIIDLPVLETTEIPQNSVFLAEFEGENCKNMSFLDVFERIYWEVIIKTAILQLQQPIFPLKILQKTENDLKTFFCLTIPQTIPPKISLLSILSRSLLQTTLQNIGLCLQKAHCSNLSHLYLSPKRLHVEASSGNVYIKGFNVSVYGLVRKYVKRKKEMKEMDYVDTEVVRYLWWKRDKTELGKRKKGKYIQKIDWKSDVYSYAMLIYSAIFRVSRPFEYVPGSEKWAGFYESVVKLHRKPVIPEVFEREYPQATDLLRRSWERAEVRPSIEELLNMLSGFSGFQQFLSSQSLSPIKPLPE